MLGLPCPIIQLKIVVGQADHPSVTYSIQLGHGYDIGQGIVVCIDIKSQSIEVFMEFLDHSQFEGDKFQLVSREMTFSLHQAPNGVGDDSIITIIMHLVEDTPQAWPTSAAMEFRRPGEICIGKDRHCGAQALQVIKGPLTPVIPCNGSFLANIFIWG